MVFSTLLDNVHLIAEFIGCDTPYVVGAKTFEHDMMMSSISVQWGLIGVAIGEVNCELGWFSEATALLSCDSNAR